MIYEYFFMFLGVVLSYLIFRPCQSGVIFRTGVCIVCIGLVAASASLDGHYFALIRAFNFVVFGLLVCGFGVILRSFKTHGQCRRSSDWID